MKLRTLLRLALLWLFATAALAQSPPPLSAAHIAPLASGEFDERLRAFDTLVQAAATQPAARSTLQALQDDAVFSTAEGRLVRSEGARYVDAASGDPVAVRADALQPLMLNNALRARIDAALAVLHLQSPDVDERRAAARTLAGEAPDAAWLPLLDAALARETDSALKHQLEGVWALAALHAEQRSDRLKAVQRLGLGQDPQALAWLAPLAAQTDDAELARAARRAIQEIESSQQVGRVAAHLFQGLSAGSILLLAALGLAITYGLMGVINMAHGEFLMVGAYAAYCVQALFRAWLPGAFDWYVLAALPVAFAAAALVGMLIEWAVLRHLYHRPLETLLATFGVSLLMIQSARTLFGAQNVEVANPAWLSGGWQVQPGLVLPYNRIAIIVFAFAVLAFAWAVLNKTRLGLFVRAVTQNRTMAGCVGVRAPLIDRYAFALGAGIAGLGGVALSQLGASVVPDMGQAYIIDSFMAVVLGGVGQLAGTVTGAMGLGVLTKLIEPHWGAVLAKIAVLVLVIVFIQRRPQGIFALKGRNVEA